jgi:hypothetical protein
VNGPLTAQTGLTINVTKDNWWTGGKVGEVDGLNVLLRQNAPGSDASGILVNVQNQGNGFLSATEFASSIVDPVSNTLTYGIDVQEGALNQPTGGYYGAVYTADYGALSTGVLIQNSSPSASWQYAIQYQKERQRTVLRRWLRAASSAPGPTSALSGSTETRLTAPSTSAI